LQLFFGISLKGKKDADKLIIKEPLISLSDSKNLRVDENDANLFYDIENEKLSIRVIKQKNKDQCLFATSIPHRFKKVRAYLMKNAISQLVEVEISQTHELLITKSPAVKFSDIGECILEFLITHIRNADHWMGERITFNVEEVNNQLRISSTLPINEFENITEELSLIKGLSIHNDGSVMGFEKSASLRYDFSLWKGSAFTWDELIPEIEKVFQDYFKNGVEFKFKYYTLNGAAFKTRHYN